MVTAMPDETSTKRNRELDQYRLRLGAVLAAIRASHISSESTMQGIDPTGGSERQCEERIMRRHYVSSPSVVPHHTTPLSRYTALSPFSLFLRLRTRDSPCGR